MPKNRNNHFTAPQMYARHFGEGVYGVEVSFPGVQTHGATARSAMDKPQRRSNALENAYLRSFLKRMSTPR